MLTPRRLWLPIAALLALAACRDATGPLDEPNALAERVSWPTPSWPTPVGDSHVLRQSPTAPALETYEVSFWAHKDRASTVVVNYLPADGQSAGQPFLRFHIPAGGLQAGPYGSRLGRRDSVFITLTIDPETFYVEFEPTGVVFSRRLPATLGIWYGNADPDYNGDGVVDAADQTLAGQLGVWVRDADRAPWLRTSSQTEPGQQWVWTVMRHFSEYAVCW